MLTDKEKESLLIKARQLDISITMYKKATNILDLDVDLNEFEDFLTDIAQLP